MEMKMGLVVACVLGTLLLSLLMGCSAIDANEEIIEKIKIEADYILLCQYMNASNTSYGAINDVYATSSNKTDKYGVPDWIVPSENAMAILGLIVASNVTKNDTYKERAHLAADYLVSVQDSDGAWYNQYGYTEPGDINNRSNTAALSKSPHQTAEVMIALYKLGYDPRDHPDEYDAMKKGAQYLMECQNIDDGLLGSGKNASGGYEKWRWIHDNCYAYWALKAAENWANNVNDTSFALICTDRSQKVLDGIDEHLYNNDTKVWHIAIYENGSVVRNAHLDDCGGPQLDEEYPSWIQYSPQMLNIPAKGVNSPEVGEWIYNKFRKDACIGGLGYDCENKQLKERLYPGFAFQAALAWLNSGNETDAEYARSAIDWAENKSGLWQTQPDDNNVTGGWKDWLNATETSEEWKRFIDTSFYAIASWDEGYDFSIP